MLSRSMEMRATKRQNMHLKNQLSAGGSLCVLFLTQKVLLLCYVDVRGGFKKESER